MMRMMMMLRIERKIGAADGAIAIAVDDGARSLCSEGQKYTGIEWRIPFGQKMPCKRATKAGSAAVQLEADHHVSAGHI